MWNDRSGEVGRELSVDQFDLDQLFGEEGVKILHLSGLIAALSPSTSKFCVELAKAAREHGTLVAMDLNYRATFWKGREEELSAAFDEIAKNCDILYGNEEDFQLCLGIEGPEAGGESIDAKIDDFKAMIGRIKDRYPAAHWIGTSLREVVSANHHKWGILLWNDGEFYLAPLRDIDVMDRIGGGDGFVGGVLYGILKGWERREVRPVRLGHRRARRDVAVRLRRPGRREAGLGPLEGQRPRPALTHRWPPNRSSTARAADRLHVGVPRCVRRANRRSSRAPRPG